MRELDDITGAIVDAAFQMHRDLGPGRLESVSETIRTRALERRGLRVEQHARQHAKQLLTYLKLTNTPVGLLINVGAPTLREGLRRIVNGFQPSAFPRLRVNPGVSANLNSKGSKTN
jgi:hypothetical protein